MKNILYLSILVVFTFLNCSSDNTSTDDEQEQDNDTLYYPPLSSDTWETKSISDLNWNENELQPLIDYLENQNTKSFIILHNGRIVVEEYMNDHDAEKTWYWASAGKTLTSTIIGIAQEEALLDIDNKVSDYIGTGWTSASLDKENLITCKNLLSMNSGLDDSLGDNVSSENLEYIADAGTRWAYHNVYKKLQDVVAQVSGESWTDYFNEKLRDQIGMSGSWLSLNDYNLFWSNTRSMARFGLLISENGTWDNNQIVSEDFLDDATSVSQNINDAYGYYWWLNGKSSYRLPGSQLEFNGSLIPNAPNDMYAALGKNDQKIYIVPSEKLVIIRMGQAGGDENFALSSFDNDLWEKINALID